MGEASSSLFGELYFQLPIYCEAWCSPLATTDCLQVPRALQTQLLLEVWKQQGLSAGAGGHLEPQISRPSIPLPASAVTSLPASVVTSPLRMKPGKFSTWEHLRPIRGHSILQATIGRSSFWRNETCLNPRFCQIRRRGP